MNDFFKRNSPPGMDLKPQWRVFLIGNIVSLLISFCDFMKRYTDARNQLFTYVVDRRELIEGAVIVPFRNLLGTLFSSFFFVICFMLGCMIYHYSYYRRDSMSIYLMKRLPNRIELHRRALTLPALAILATLVAALVALLLYFMIYLLATPRACLPYAALREIWR